MVFSTGTATESVAKAFRQQVDRCVHAIGVGDSLDAVERKLDQAERFLGAAEKLRELSIAQGRLSVVEVEADNESAYYDEYGDLVNEVDTLSKEIDSDLASLENPPTLAAAALNLADDHLKAVKAGLKSMPPAAGRVKALRARYHEIASGIAVLRRIDQHHR